MIEDDNDIEKALRPEVTREQLYAIVQGLHEVIEALIETPEEETDSEETEDTMEIEDVPEIDPANPSPLGYPNKNDVNWPVVKSVDETGYESDNEDEDKWDNLTKACWSGYKQEGMKDKGGRMVPNCVPVEKSEDLPKEDQIKKSIWSGTFIK